MYKRIRDLREDHDMNQTQVAKFLGMSQTGYSKYETGENDLPAAVLIKLVRLYNTSIDYLLGETDEIKRYPQLNVIYGKGELILISSPFKMFNYNTYTPEDNTTISKFLNCRYLKTGSLNLQYSSTSKVLRSIVFIALRPGQDTKSSFAYFETWYGTKKARESLEPSLKAKRLVEGEYFRTAFLFLTTHQKFEPSAAAQLTGAPSYMRSPVQISFPALSKIPASPLL